ncbi:MAG TPA: DUF2336 domain-containing protein, partial [Alphaproteobacteria bacterium]|nr:DUF2336 domain-containing protein [Alphaproteobacteria bacterium]
GPVIEQSPHLTSDDLVMLAWTKSQEHLAAIGSRTRVDAAVTSVLVERADGEVIRKIAKNDGAEFSTDGFAKLAQRAIHDDELAEVVGTRADIPTEVLHAMMTQVEAAVQSRILAAAHPHMKGEVESAITAASHSPHDYSAARQRVIELQQAGQLAERELIHLIQSGRIDEALVALELMSSTPVEVIERFLWGAAAETMPVVCKAAGLSWMAAEATLALASAVGQPLSEGAKRKALAAYSKLTRSTAEKLLRFWFVRGSNRAGRRPREGHDIAAARRKGQKPA